MIKIHVLTPQSLTFSVLASMVAAVPALDTDHTTEQIERLHDGVSCIWQKSGWQLQDLVRSARIPVRPLNGSESRSGVGW
jgi:hypothetical protein